MAKKKKLKQKPESIQVKEMEFNYKIHRNDKIAHVLTALIANFLKYGAYAFIAYMTYKCIGALSGKTTITRIIVNFFENLQIKDILCIILGLSGIIYGILQKYFRKRSMRKTDERIQKLESMVASGQLSAQSSRERDKNKEKR
jgi:hypothetical protein